MYSNTVPLSFIIFIISLAALIVSGNWLVQGAVAIATKARMSKAFIGLTIVSAGTSAPEFVVSLFAVITGSDDISVGNIVGSNIFNIALILGATAIVFPLKAKREALRKDWPFMMISSILFYFLIRDGALDRLESAFLFTLFLVFMYYSLRVGKSDQVGLPIKGKPWQHWLMLIGGIAGLAIAANFMISSAGDIARSFGVPERIIGLTLFAFGTSLPELITSMVAAYRKESDIVLGNILGSNIFNVMLVMGSVGMISTVSSGEELINFDMLWMLAFAFALLPMLLLRRITKIEGALLLMGMIAYSYFLFIRGF